MSKLFDVIVIGELNVDIILNRIDGQPEIGKEILAKDMTVTLGSSSAIFASNLSSLGARVAFIGKIGTDNFAQIVLESLQKKGVDTSMVIQTSAFNTGATIVLNYEEDRANVTYPGAMNDFRIDDIDFNFVAQAKHLHFSSYFLQPGIGPDITVIYKKAKELGLTTSLDPQWDPAEKWDLPLKELLPYTDIFLPNIKELQYLTGTNSLDEGIQSLKNFANNVVVKHGNEGAYLWNGNELIHQPAFLNKQVVDCIGAGDSFNAGFIFKYVGQNSPEKCLEFGALTGAISTTGEGGTSAFADKVSFREVAKQKFNFTI